MEPSPSSRNSASRDDLVVAFGVGYYSHLAADALDPLVAGRWADLAFLGWPLLPVIEPTSSRGIVAFFAALARDLAAGHVTAFVAVQLALVLFAAALWIRHGYPGLPTIGTPRMDPENVSQSRTFTPRP